MFTQTHRPRRFSEVIGQKETVAVMRAVVNDPETSPRVYVFQGGMGRGKTSIARVFARALHCENPQHGDACLACESCKSFSDFTPNYQEYDSTQVGNVSFFRQLKDHLNYATTSDGFRVIVFDEIHAAGAVAQNALLKLLEEGPRDTFFILCTTDVDKIISTIRSRSIEMTFTPVADNEIKTLLERICISEGISKNNEVIERIVAFSFGHVRDAVMKLDLYKQVGNDEEFLKLLHLPEATIIRLFLTIKDGAKEEFIGCIESLSGTPLAYLKKSFDICILNSLKVFSGVPVTAFSDGYAELNKLYGTSIFNVLALMSKDWVANCFTSDLQFQALMWYMFYALGKTSSTPVAEAPSRYQK